MKRHSFALLLDLIVATIIVGGLAYAGVTGTISGTILDKETNLVIPGARVQIIGTTFGAMANPMDGSFVILNIPAGTYTIVASCIGYQKATANDLVVMADSTITLNFTLVSEAIGMDSMVVIAKAPQIDKDEVSCVSRVDKKALKSLPVTDISGKLKAQSGFVAQGGAIHVRGSRADEMGIVDDGALIKDQLGGYGNVNVNTNGNANVYYQPPFNTEEYKHFYDSQYQNPIDNPLSTFSIDVDAASYSNIRRFINEGNLPPVDAVRTEELINYFKYDYPQPEGDIPFSVSAEIACSPWQPQYKLVQIGLQGKELSSRELPPSNIVFLLDVSGSMADEDKLPLLKSAFKMLVRQLRREDRVAIVIYADNTRLALPSTSGADKATILTAIDELSSGGCTAGGAGMQMAYNVAVGYFCKNSNNRVIWATDGDFNVGPSSDEEMVRMVEERRNQGIFLSILGFGQGNLKDSRMEQIADKGNGNYYYIDNIQEARKVLVGQLSGTLMTIAKDVKIQVEFNPARVYAYRLIGYENRLMNKEDFNNDRKDAGEMGAGQSVTALYEIIPANGESERLLVDPLKYQKVRNAREFSDDEEMLTVKVRYKEPKGSQSRKVEIPVIDHRQPFIKASANLRFAAAVAEFGMLLRNSPLKGNSSFQQVEDIAKRSLGEDNEGYRHEFVRIAESCESLTDRAER